MKRISLWTNIFEVSDSWLNTDQCTFFQNLLLSVNMFLLCRHTISVRYIFSRTLNTHTLNTVSFPKYEVWNDTLLFVGLCKQWTLETFVGPLRGAGDVRLRLYDGGRIVKQCLYTLDCLEACWK